MNGTRTFTPPRQNQRPAETPPEVATAPTGVVPDLRPGQATKALTPRPRHAQEPLPHSTAPTSQVAVIEASEYKAELYSMLCSGISPRRASRLLYQRYGVNIPATAVQDFLQEIPLTNILPLSHLRQRLLALDVEVDTVGEMKRTLHLASERLDSALLLEEVTGKPSTITDRVLKEYWKMLLEFLEIQQGLGELPKAAQEAVLKVSEGDQGLPSLRAVLALEVGGSSPPVQRGPDNARPIIDQEAPSQELLDRSP